jgi:hypothetical protein
MTLNLLVSILGDIHSRVMAVYKSERLRAKCRLINENEILFDRQRIFSNTKYVVRAEIEKLESSENPEDEDNHDTSNDDFISHVKKIVGQSDDKHSSNFKVLK